MQQINNLKAKIAKFRDQIDASIQRVVSSGWGGLGPEVKRFEASFAEYLGAAHCITVANGTDAIELANTERLAKEILTLSCYPEMEDADVSAVIQAVNGWAA